MLLMLVSCSRITLCVFKVEVVDLRLLACDDIRGDLNFMEKITVCSII